MKKLMCSVAASTCLLTLLAGVAFAGTGGTNTGQPGSGDNVHCNMGSLLGITSPGNSTAPANNSSAFNPNAMGPNGQPVGGSRYAGNMLSGNTKAQSQAAMNGGQYDVACLNAQIH
jgi:hypothetical protein